MYATAWGFSHPLVMLLAAFPASCLGGALGLRCLNRSLRAERSWRAGWLVLGAVAIGCGIWVTHTVAMTGFTVAGATVGYDPWTLYASLGVAVVMIGTGVFIVGHRGLTGPALFTGGTLTGLGIASMHYLSMAGVQLDGRLDYNTLVVTASVVIAVLAATGALWAAGRHGGRLWEAGAGLSMGLAGVGMHYVGMAAVRVRLYGVAAAGSGDPPVRTLVVLLIGPVAFLVLLTVFVLTVPRPVRVVGAGKAEGAKGATGRLALLPAQRSGRAESSRVRSRAGQNR